MTSLNAILNSWILESNGLANSCILVSNGVGQHEHSSTIKSSLLSLSFVGSDQ